MKLSGNISHYDPETICKFGKRKKLAIKKILKKPFSTSKLSPTKMELWGGENAYREGLSDLFNFGSSSYNNVIILCF